MRQYLHTSTFKYLTNFQKRLWTNWKHSILRTDMAFFKSLGLSNLENEQIRKHHHQVDNPERWSQIILILNPTAMHAVERCSTGSNGSKDFVESKSSRCSPRTAATSKSLTKVWRNFHTFFNKVLKSSEIHFPNGLHPHEQVVTVSIIFLEPALTQILIRCVIEEGMYWSFFRRDFLNDLSPTPVYNYCEFSKNKGQEKNTDASFELRRIWSCRSRQELSEKHLIVFLNFVLIQLRNL